MGAKTWMLAYSDGNAADVLRNYPNLDRAATAEAARQLFPAERLVPIEDGKLWQACPPEDEICVACFPGLTIVAAAEFGIDSPSQLDPHFIEYAKGRKVALHAMHSVVDWFAYAVWQEGRLVRSLSVSPDSGVIEDVGTRLPFEEPYWAGAHPAIDPADMEDGEEPYPFPFHPLELGEAALLDLFGYQIEGAAWEEAVDPDKIVLMRFKRGKPWWKFW